MTQADLRRVLVDAPTGPPRRYGLYSVADVRGLGAHEAMGVQYEPEECLIPTALSVGPCMDSPTKASTAFPDLVWGDAFAVYSAADCKPVGRTLADIRRRIRHVLELGEEAAVERELWAILAARADDVTEGGGPMLIVDALAVLERAFAPYGTSGTILAPRELSGRASNEQLLWERDRGTLETAIGNRWGFIDHPDPTVGPPVAPDPTPAPAPAGSSWMYITGPVVVRRGDVEDAPPSASMVRNAEGAYTNDTFVLSERVIVPTVDCPTFAVLVIDETEVAP